MKLASLLSFPHQSHSSLWNDHLSMSIVLKEVGLFLGIWSQRSDNATMACNSSHSSSSDCSDQKPRAELRERFATIASASCWLTITLRILTSPHTVLGDDTADICCIQSDSESTERGEAFSTSLCMGHTPVASPPNPQLIELIFTHCHFSWFGVGGLQVILDDLLMGQRHSTL